MQKKPTYEELEQHVTELEARLQRLESKPLTSDGVDFISALVDKVPAMAHSIDENGILLNVSKIWLAKMGYNQEEVIGKKSVSFLTEQSRKLAEQSFLPEFFQKGYVENIPYQFKRKDGSLIETLMSAITFHDSKGKFQRSLAVLTDITERKVAEKMAEQSAAELRLAQSIAGTGNWSLAPESGEPVCSEEVYKIYERDPNAGPFSIEDCKRLYQDDHWEKFHRAMRRARKEGEPYDLELKLKLDSGKEKWIRIICEPKKSNNSPDHYLRGTIQDITESKLFELILRESELKWRNILINTPQIGIALDPEATIIFANKHFLQLTGWQEREVIGKNWFELFIPEKIQDEMHHVFKTTMASRDTKEFSNYENEIVARDGTLLNIAWSNVLSKNHLGQVIDVTCFGIDLTERKRMEEELRQAHKMEAVGTLAGGIAHEFNNILGIIIGNIELASADVPDWSPLQTNLAEIKMASMRARDVVRQLLSFTRKSRHRKNTIDINEVVVESLELIRASLPPNIEIRKDLATQALAVKADATQIQQVILNTCSNAAHAMEDGGGILSVMLSVEDFNESSWGVEQTPVKGRYARLSFADTGVGMGDETLERIFDPYFTTKGVGKGSGMGMAVTHGIIKNHDGKISVATAAGKGTTFTFLFPLSSESFAREERREGAEVRGNESILLVDDEEPVVKMTTIMLSRLGYQVRACAQPEEALALFQQQPDQFDLIISDLTMPKISGVQLADRVKKIREDIPVVIISGYVQEDGGKNEENENVSAFMVKPLSKEELSKTIRKALDGT